MNSTPSTEPYPVRILFILLAAAILIPPVFCQDESGSDEILVPFYLSGEYMGEILMITEGGENLFSYEQLYSYIVSGLSPDGISALQDQGEGRSMISVLNIRACGLIAEFREDYLDLQVDIPPSLKKEEFIVLGKTASIYTGTELYQAPLSGWVNNRLHATHIYQENDFQIEESLGAGINFRTWVLDSEVTFSNGETPFTLDYARVVKDLPLINCSMELGDLSYGITGVDDIAFATGVSLVRNFKINPDITREPVGERELFLENDSLVEIEVNGKIIREMNLTAGLYHFQDFNLSEGINKVKIYITDDEGEREEAFIMPLASDLLKEKEVDFGVGIGVPDREAELPILYSHQRVGVTDRLTFELKEVFPFSTQQLYLEFNGAGATPFGNIYLKTAVSSIPEETADFTLFGQYRYSDPSRPELGSFGLNGRYDMILQDPDESKTGETDITSTIYYSKPIVKGLSVTPSIIYTDGSETSRSIKGKVLFRKSLKGGSSISFDFSFKWLENDSPVMEGTISFSNAFPEYNQSLMLQQNVGEQTFFMNWNRFPDEDEGFDFNASTQIPFDTLERSTYSFGSGYNHPFGIVDIRHRMTTIFDDPEQSVNTTNFTLSNGFVFAGKSWGLTRTVNDSFVIVEVDESVEEQGVRVNPSDGTEQARAGKMNAVLNDLQSYRTIPVKLLVEDLPPGTDLDTTKYVFTPTFRGGAVITASIEENVYIGGRLLDRDGEPFEYVLGRIVPAGTSEDGTVASGEAVFDGIEFFTDEDGSFEIYNLTPGEWEISLSIIDSGGILLTIPPGTFGYFPAGDLKEADE